VTICTWGEPGSIELSPEIAFAISEAILSIFAPRSLPSVPAPENGLPGSRC